jgi:hypothetical protein
MSHLQANLRTSERLSSLLLGVPKRVLFTFLFVSKADNPWVVVNGLLSGCSFHFQLVWITVRTVSNKHFGTPKTTNDKRSLVLRLA